MIGIGYGKTIFLGEHFVVYGCKAIGFGLDKEVRVRVEKSPQMNLKSIGEKRVKKAINLLKQELNVGNFSIQIVHSEIPVASGLGSSAALGVATIRALSKEFHLNLSDEEVCKITYKWEKVFHDTPSGIDNTLATYGGAIIFQKRLSGKSENVIKKIKLGKPLHVIIADTGVIRKTEDLVRQVSTLKEKNENLFQKLLETENELVKRAVRYLRVGKLKEIGELMNINHGLLNALGVSHLENEKIVNLARNAGALGAKVVGAGGGGCCIALAKNKKSAMNILDSLSRKYRAFYSKVT